MRSNGPTLDLLILYFRMIFPPDLLPCVPATALVHASRDDASDGLAHGFGRLPCPFLKADACGVDDIVPEVDSNLKVFLTQLHPSIEFLSYK